MTIELKLTPEQGKIYNKIHPVSIAQIKKTMQENGLECRDIEL